MSALTLSAKLDRTDNSTPWGFRMHGGKDFGAALTIQRVTPGSLAAKCGLQVGDAILKIGDAPTETLKHKEAQQHIIMAGNSLELTLQRGGGYTAPPTAPAQSYYTPPAASPSYSSPAAPAFAPSGAQSQNYNVAPKPFVPGGGASTVPVAMNKQYNTPISMYSVDNVMNSLSNKTANMSMGPAQPQPGGRQWGSSPGGPPASNSWLPKIPTGPRKMKVGRRGEARSMATATGGRIPICESCGITIRGPFVLALEKSWCPDHFLCSNPNCRQGLIDVGFVEENGQLFCENDYEQYFAPKCGKCGKAIVGDIINALKNTFHTHCFVCVHCNTSIGTGSFHVEDGKVYCEKDWGSLFQTKCYGCQFPIEPGDRWVEALNQNWHSECFNCSTCQVNLEGQSFFAKGGRPYCKKHASAGRF